MNKKEIERIRKFIQQCKNGESIDSIGDIVVRQGRAFPHYIKLYVDEYELLHNLLTWYTFIDI